MTYVASAGSETDRSRGTRKARCRMAREPIWKMFQDQYLVLHHENGSEFTNREAADVLNCTWQEASSYIQSQLGAQRAQKSKTLYVLTRVDGTRGPSSRWIVGEKVAYAKTSSKGWFSDTEVRLTKAIIPDWTRTGRSSPARRSSWRPGPRPSSRVFCPCWRRVRRLHGSSLRRLHFAWEGWALWRSSLLLCYPSTHNARRQGDHCPL